MAQASNAAPLVNIGLPVYNGGERVRRAIDSLLAQDYPNFELIISDNASTDGTWDILQEYAARDPRIRLYRNARNIGMTRNFNRVYELATGEYFMWAAHDDRWEPGFISTCVQYLLAHPDVAMCYAGQPVTPFRRDPALDHPEAWRRALSLLETWPAPAVAFYGLFRRAALRPALPLVDIEGPDAVLLMQAALAGPIAILPQALRYYELSPRNIRMRLQQMGHRTTVFNVWRWDFRLL
ncbi:MAG: glycosyltransferase family 2 protein, partial [Aggregatilineales bacterium]